MPKRGRHRKGGRVTPKGTRPARGRGSAWNGPETHDEPDLMLEIRRALRSGDPLDLLAQASGLLTLVDPREYGFGREQPEPSMSRRQLVDMFIDVDRVETSALLAAIAALAGDDLEATRIRRELAQRDASLPSWLVHLGDAEVYRAQEMVHVLGDGDNIHVAVRMAGGHEMTAVVYIDHNVGTLVKDAFLVPEPIDRLEALMREHVEDPDTVWRDLPLADARARITDAIERAAITVPPFTSDTWPMCRPIVEWIAARMPAGGSGYERPEWSDDDRQSLIDRFFASPIGAPLDDADRRGLVDTFVWFGADYGPGDPMRWSSVAVEILLDDWIPRKIAADVDYLAKAPDVLRAFVRFCHAERGIRPDLTDETLAAVDRYEPDYQRAIRSPRLQGPMAILAAMGALDPDDPDHMFDPDAFVPTPSMHDLLSRAAGGEEALDALDERPLPDEEFDWTGVADDIRGRVAEVLALCDRCCDELLDVEYRTACRRLLARAATGDPTVFRRRARSETAAAAICWIVGKDNDLFTVWGSGMQVKELLAHFGLQSGSVSQRANTIMRAAGFDPTERLWDIRLGAPELLVSSRRRKIIELRDKYADNGP